MKLFVTGGSGFLGSNFIQYALSQSDKITINALSRSSITDELILKTVRNIEKGHERVRLIRGHINDENPLKEGLDGAKVVIHMAAKVSISLKIAY